MGRLQLRRLQILSLQFVFCSPPSLHTESAPLACLQRLNMRCKRGLCMGCWTGDSSTTAACTDGDEAALTAAADRSDRQPPCAPSRAALEGPTGTRGGGGWEPFRRYTTAHAALVPPRVAASHAPGSGADRTGMPCRPMSTAEQLRLGYCRAPCPAMPRRAMPCCRRVEQL